MGQYAWEDDATPASTSQSAAPTETSFAWDEAEAPAVPRPVPAGLQGPPTGSMLNEAADSPSQFSHANPVRYADEVMQGAAQGIRDLAHPIDAAKKGVAFLKEGLQPQGPTPDMSLGDVADTIAKSWGQLGVAEATGKVAGNVAGRVSDVREFVKNGYKPPDIHAIKVKALNPDLVGNDYVPNAKGASQPRTAARPQPQTESAPQSESQTSQEPSSSSSPKTVQEKAEHFKNLSDNAQEFEKVFGQPLDKFVDENGKFDMKEFMQSTVKPSVRASADATGNRAQVGPGTAAGEVSRQYGADGVRLLQDVSGQPVHEWDQIWQGGSRASRTSRVARPGGAEPTEQRPPSSGGGVIGQRTAKPRTPGEPLQQGFNSQPAEDLGYAARQNTEATQGTMPRSDRRVRVRTADELQTQQYFKQARTELGEDASSDDVMARVAELKSPKGKAMAAGQGGHAGNGVASEEEINRPGVNVTFDKTGKPTYHGKAFAPEATQPGHVHATVFNDGTFRVNEGTPNPAQELGVKQFMKNWRK